MIPLGGKIYKIIKCYKPLRQKKKKTDRTKNKKLTEYELYCMT